MGYSKLHSSLVNSSLWCERDDVRLLFVTMLALADYNGDIFGSWGGIARQANIAWPPEDGCRDPFAILMEPDADSSDLLRNPENEGRRIEEIEGGFHIINFRFFRGLRNDDDRREQNRRAQERYRNKNKPKSAENKQKSASGEQKSAYTEAEAEAEAEAACITAASASVIQAKEKEKEKEMSSSFNAHAQQQRPTTKYGYPLPPRCSIRAQDGAVLDYTGRVMDINQVRNALAAAGIATTSSPLS